jgi:hypothetical protein
MHPHYVFTIINIDGPTLVPSSFSDVFIFNRPICNIELMKNYVSWHCHSLKAESLSLTLFLGFILLKKLAD